MAHCVRLAYRVADPVHGSYIRNDMPSRLRGHIEVVTAERDDVVTTIGESGRDGMPKEARGSGD